MTPDPNRIVVVVSGGLVQDVYADDFRHIEVVVLDFDCDNLEEEDMASDDAMVKLPDGKFARAYDEEASDIRKIGVDAGNKAAYEHVLQTKRCPTCDTKLKFFMHNCQYSSDHPEIFGCPKCDDECGHCN